MLDNDRFGNLKGLGDLSQMLVKTKKTRVSSSLFALEASFGTTCYKNYNGESFFHNEYREDKIAK